MTQPIITNSALQVSTHLMGQTTPVGNQLTDRLYSSFSQSLEQLVELVPRLVSAALVLLLGYLAAHWIAKLITMLSDRVGLQRATERSGISESIQRAGIRRSVPEIMGTIVFWLVLLVFLMAASNIVGLPALTVAMGQLVAYIPKLLVATVIVVIGLLLASFLRGVIATSADRIGITYAQQLANACYYLLGLMVFIAAFEQLEIRFEMLSDAILIAFAAAAFGFGLAFGLGGRDVISGILAGYYVRQRIQAGDEVRVGELQGRVREVGPVATVIETEEEGLLHRRSVPNAIMLNEAVG